MKYQNRSTTADAVIINKGKILLIKRKNNPFKNYWAIPGGFVEINETTSQCSLRELEEETNLKGKIVKLIGIYDTVERDPRKTICIAYLVKPITSIAPSPNDDASEVDWFPLKSLPKLAFDHAKIIKDAVKLIK